MSSCCCGDSSCSCCCVVVVVVVVVMISRGSRVVSVLIPVEMVVLGCFGVVLITCLVAVGFVVVRRVVFWTC